MKRLAAWVTVLLLAGLPLTAAAVDYGSNSLLLAADTGAPQLPAAVGHATAKGELAKPGPMMLDANAADDSAEANEAVPVPTQRMAPSTASPRPTSAPRNPSTSASNKPHATPAPPAPVPAPASWQSLLPGSIQ